MSFSSRSQNWESFFRKPIVRRSDWLPSASGPSLALIEKAALSRSAHILDLGGSHSFLTDQLQQKGFSNLSVLDLSEEEEHGSREWLGTDAKDIKWLRPGTELFLSRVDIWHDRAVFGFIDDPMEIEIYVDMVSSFLRKGSTLIIGVPCGTESAKDKGYDLLRLAAVFAPHFELEESVYEDHFSPFGQKQRQLFGRFIRR